MMSTMIYSISTGICGASLRRLGGEPVPTGEGEGRRNSSPEPDTVTVRKNFPKGSEANPYSAQLRNSSSYPHAHRRNCFMVFLDKETMFLSKSPGFLDICQCASSSKPEVIGTPRSKQEHKLKTLLGSIILHLLPPRE